MKKLKLYWTLFSSSFKISLFMIGSGLVAIPIMKARFVEELKWLDDEDMTDLVAIAQSAPGPISVNTSMLIGYKVAGVAGGLCTICGTVLSPLILITIIQLCYQVFISNPYIVALFRGMNASVAAIMIQIVLNMGWTSLKADKVFSAVIMIIAFVLVYFVEINAAFVMLGAILAGVAVSLFGLLGREKV